MKSKIDVVRGVSVMKHKASGILVYMYLDTPGVYLNTFGDEVSEKIAAEAGFEVAKLGKAKKKAELMSAYMREVEAQLEMGDSPMTILAEREGYKVVTNGQGYSRIILEDGSALNPMPIPDAEALSLLDEIVPPAPAPAAEDEGADNGGSQS